MPVFSLCGCTDGKCCACAGTRNSYPSNKLNTWSIGVNAGALTPISPLGGKNDFSNWKTNLGYGLYIKKQFTPYFSLRLDGMRGKLSG